MVKEKNKASNKINYSKTVSINNLSHFYGRNENKKQVLNNVNLSIQKSELVLLKGPSGCGKTTLLTLIGALRTCQSGDLKVLNNQLNGAILSNSICSISFRIPIIASQKRSNSNKHSLSVGSTIKVPATGQLIVGA